MEWSRGDVRECEKGPGVEPSSVGATAGPRSVHVFAWTFRTPGALVTVGRVGAGRGQVDESPELASIVSPVTLDGELVAEVAWRAVTQLPSPQP